MTRFFVILLLLFGALAAKAQFVEEVGTLESLYESRARSLLNSFLRPHEYSVVISAEIDHDQKKLDQYREKVELQFIPGLPIPMDPSGMPATNDLHSMKSKITVDLVLNTDVSPEKEALLKSVLISKLHLDESAGDAVVISRSKFPDSEVQAHPRILPEFSWKTWALIVLLALLAFAGLVFYLYSRASRQSEEDQEIAPEPLIIEPKLPKALEPVAENEAARLAAEELEAARDLAEVKDQILFLAAQYPLISARAVSEVSEQDEETVLRTFETLSWDLSRRLFSGLSPRVWGRLGLKVKAARAKKPTTVEYLASLQIVYRAILARFLESGAERDDANPFAFFFRLKNGERKRLTEGESATTFAMISIYCPSEELDALIKLAPTEVADEIPTEMTRLENLPEASILTVANRLRDRLKKLKEAPSVSADAMELAAKILRTYSPEREVEAFNRMKSEDPEGAERMRRILLQFEDVTKLPVDYVSTALSLLDVDQIVRAFFELDSDMRKPLFGMLPPKRAKMIERDLESTGTQISGAEMAANRRILCRKIEEVIAGRGKTLEQALLEAQNGGLRLAA